MISGTLPLLDVIVSFFGIKFKTLVRTRGGGGGGDEGVCVLCIEDTLTMSVCFNLINCHGLGCVIIHQQECQGYIKMQQ